MSIGYEYCTLCMVNIVLQKTGYMALVAGSEHKYLLLIYVIERTKHLFEFCSCTQCLLRWICSFKRYTSIFANYYLLNNLAILCSKPSLQV